MATVDETMDVLMEVAQLQFKLTCDPKLVDVKSVQSEFMSKIQDNNMMEYYKVTADLLKWKLDQKLIGLMEAKNEQHLKELEGDLKDANENHGEIEVMEAQLKIARHHSRTGTKAKALESLKLVEELKSLSTGQKIDVVLETIRIGLFWQDSELVKTSIVEADKLLELGGDWDRRNRLKVYRALFAMTCRDFDTASENFLSAVATFTSYELCPYDTFVFYTIISGICTLDRVTFKKKIVDAPEILSIIHENKPCENLINNIYNCSYKEFFIALTQVYDQISTDRYLAVHRDWFVREMRVLAYRQFLESYKSITLKSMAKSFGVSVKFLDSELAHFISSLRLNAKIDKTSGVIETNRPLHSNSQYQKVIKEGDLLLNRVQMLSRAINV